MGKFSGEDFSQGNLQVMSWVELSGGEYSCANFMGFFTDRSENSSRRKVGGE